MRNFNNSKDHKHSKSSSEKIVKSTSSVQRYWPISVNVRSNMDVSNGFGNRMDKDVSQICAEVLHTSSSSPQELGDSFRNNVSEDSPITSHLLRDDSLQEIISLGLGFLVSDRERGQGGGSVLQADVGLEAAVLDLVADDSGGMQKQKSRFHWDKRSKKYIKLNNRDHVTASGKIKTEGGAKVTANKTGIYKSFLGKRICKIASSNADDSHCRKCIEPRHCLSESSSDSLSQYFGDPTRCPLEQGGSYSSIQFSWRTRTRICIGIARGLAILHEEVRPHIVHRDIKASNILLDKDLTPKISDFGLPKLIAANMTHVSTRVAGTIILLG
ncbi:unnamed protein product [Camellia sinensis]